MGGRVSSFGQRDSPGWQFVVFEAVLRAETGQGDARLQWPSSTSPMEHVLSRHRPHVYDCPCSWHSEPG